LPPDRREPRTARPDWALLVIAAVVFAAGAFAGRLSDRTRALVLGFGAGAGFGVDEIAVRLIDSVDLTQASFYANPAIYALVAGGAAGFLLLTSALSRGSVTTAVAGMVIGETVGPALVGVAWLGDRTRPGLGWMVEAGFVVAVVAALALSRFGEAPDPAGS
jgi:drug/metabolite transporter (DMT)-like permease